MTRLRFWDYNLQNPKRVAGSHTSWGIRGVVIQQVTFPRATGNVTRSLHYFKVTSVLAVKRLQLLLGWELIVLYHCIITPAPPKRVDLHLGVVCVKKGHSSPAIILLLQREPRASSHMALFGECPSLPQAHRRLTKVGGPCLLQASPVLETFPPRPQTNLCRLSCAGSWDWHSPHKRSQIAQVQLIY